VVLAEQVPYKILRGKILDLCYSSAPPAGGATGLLFICGLTPAVLSQEIIKKYLDRYENFATAKNLYDKFIIL